jgi:hypothetical protein
LVEAQNNIVVLRESVQHLYHVVETTLVRETRSSPRESRPVTTTRVSNDDPDRAARSTRLTVSVRSAPSRSDRPRVSFLLPRRRRPPVIDQEDANCTDEAEVAEARQLLEEIEGLLSA